MNLIGAIRSEAIKMKHTPFGIIHVCIPAAGAMLYIIYYLLYGSTADERRLKMILELTATVFPLLISVIVGLNAAVEEKASHFQNMLAVPNRCRLLFAKVMYLYGAGIVALGCLLVLFVAGMQMFNRINTVLPAKLFFAAVGIAFCNFVIYVLHLFLSLKFGLGVSLFWGVFESLQCILYSNIELKGVARYIPFAWSMNWIQDVLKNQVLIHRTEWIWIVILMIGSFGLVLFWFSQWEGRKSSE